MPPHQPEHEWTSLEITVFHGDLYSPRFESRHRVLKEKKVLFLSTPLWIKSYFRHNSISWRKLQMIPTILNSLS